MEFQARPFNMETVFAQIKKKQTKKLRGPDSPLYVSIWPMMFVVRVFGLAPYDFLQDRLVPSNTYLIFSATAVTLYTYIFYITIQKFIANKLLKIIDKTEITKMIINYGVTIYGLGLTVFTRRSFTKTWNALQDYDEDVRQLGYPRKETQTAIVAWIVTIIATVIWIAVNRIGMYAFFETWAYNMGYLIIYIGNSIAVYKFVAMAFFLGQRFHHLNAMTIKNLPSTSRNKSIITISKTTILNLHNDLMVAAENLESIYLWSLLFWIGNLGLHIVNNIFFIIVHILESGHEENNKRKPVSWPLISCLSAWMLAFLLQLLLLHIACHYASSQANYISTILMEWQVRLMKRNEYVESLLQFQNRRLNFSAGGCFYVNLPLLCSIAALSTTYLVILLQLP